MINFQLNKIRQRCIGKKIVLVGGCFDILHPGHVYFLEQAKKKGDFLVIFLESDQRIRRQKGDHKPVHSQKERAYILSRLKSVDYVTLLPDILKDEDYDKLVMLLSPDIIVTTKGDPNLPHYKRTAKIADAKLIATVRLLKNYSTSKIINSLINK